ncbi:MAG: PilN domain-containing protein [Micropepsaceae bacterium]
MGYDDEKGAMLADVAIVPLLRVRPIEQRLRALGLGPAAIDVEDDNGAAQGFDLREPPSPDDLRRGRLLIAGLAVGAIAIWAAANYAWGHAGDSEIQSLEARIAEFRPAAERSALLKQQIESVAGPIAQANSRDPAEALDVLQHLTRLLPDSVQVLDLSIEGRLVRLSGLAANATDLIGILEGSDAFKGVKFVSPVVRKSETGVERFEIAMQRETGTL